jgi:hypothetical protein
VENTRAAEGAPTRGQPDRSPDAGNWLPPDNDGLGGPGENASFTLENVEGCPPVVTRHDLAVELTVNEDETDDGDAQSPIDYVVSESPPWLTSMVTHLVLLIILALLLIPGKRRKRFEVDAVFAEQIGEQTEELVMTFDPITVAEDQSYDASEMELPPVDSPLFAPPEVTLVPDSDTGARVADSPNMALLLTGRELGRKQALLQAFGGTAETEESVRLALEWLKRYQRRQGYWSLRGPFKSGATIENREAATGLALLAFQGAGNTTKKGRYQQEVSRGWQFMLERQTEGGCFYRQGDFNHRFYTHAIATLAICELYGMTRDETYQEPAQRALDYLVQLQNPLGGWRYDPGVDADTSVTGWVLLALYSGQAAGLHVPSKVFDRISHYLDLASTYDGARYGYKPGHVESPSMTAEALLCRQYLGWQRNDPRLAKGVDYLRDQEFSYRLPNVYSWYYATQVMHHMEGDIWMEWNEVLRDIVPKEQVRDGKEKGSWYAADDRWGRTGGRLFTTCLSTYMLEVYYRHLPIYSPVFRFENAEVQ